MLRKPRQRTDVMFVLRRHQCHKHVHIKERNHGRRLFGAIHQTVNVFGFENWRSQPAGKDGYATLETNVRIGYPPEQSVREAINAQLRFLPRVHRPSPPAGAARDRYNGH